MKCVMYGICSFFYNFVYIYAATAMLSLVHKKLQIWKIYYNDILVASGQNFSTGIFSCFYNF